MIQINIHTKFNRIPAITAAIRPAFSELVLKTAHDIEAGVKLEMRRSKSGKEYRRGKGQGLTRKGTVRKRRSMHKASAPGEAPAVDIGQLINSIQVEPETASLTMTVGTNVEYAMALEYGFPRRNLAARPVWRPVAEKLRPKFIEAAKFILRSIRSGVGGFSIKR